MRILILGGDGYLGWPTAMRFSAKEIFNLKQMPGIIRKRLDKLGLREEIRERPQHNKHRNDSARRARQLANSLAGRPQKAKKDK